MKKEVKRIAELAKLVIKEDELEDFASEFKDILSYIDQLSGADIEDAAPYYELNIQNSFRADVVDEYAGHEVVKRIAPEETGFQIVVPRILQNE